MGAKAVTCFSSAAAAMKQPPAYFGSAAFAHLRWTLAGEQRDERARLFCRKLLRRLDGMDMPFYPCVGLMNHAQARQRFVTGQDDWSPIESPFLDGVAIEFAHCVAQSLPAKCWELFAEVAFDVAKLSQISIAWGGLSRWRRPGLFIVVDDVKSPPSGWAIDTRTYRARTDVLLPFEG